MATVRVATFNLENFDETPAGARPSLDERIALMRPQIVRLRADVVCFQEVHGQERPGQPRALLGARLPQQESAGQEQETCRGPGEETCHRAPPSWDTHHTPCTASQTSDPRC